MNTLLACASNAEAIVEWVQMVHGISLVQSDNQLHLNQLLEHNLFELIIIDEKCLDRLSNEQRLSIKDTKIIVLGKPPKSNEASLTNVVDYCPKPVQYPRLLKSFTRVFKVRGGASITSISKQMMVIKSDGLLVNLALNDVCALESMRDYVLFRTENHRYIVHSTLKYVQDLLKEHPEFIQIHRSFVVNSVKICEKTGSTVTICDQVYPVSRTNRHKLKYLMLG